MKPAPPGWWVDTQARSLRAGPSDWPLHAEVLLDWKQNADEVMVKLRVGAGPLRLEEVDAAFTDTDCVVRFPGASAGRARRV